ncbi:MAG TPA: hypothetical protein DEV98_05975 [Clostridiales bacterium]|nr:hypothetical protein [Clostridiales bacterium]
MRRKRFPFLLPFLFGKGGFRQFRQFRRAKRPCCKGLSRGLFGISTRQQGKMAFRGVRLTGLPDGTEHGGRLFQSAGNPPFVQVCAVYRKETEWHRERKNRIQKN